jgi:quinol monooxygenase YgiN
MIHVIARIEVKPETADEARKILESLVGETRKEPGNLAYTLFQQADAPHIFQTVEEWKDKSDLDGHMKTPHIAAAMKSAGPMFATPPDIKVFSKLK